jgi:hypothetical protein
VIMKNYISEYCSEITVTERISARLTNRSQRRRLMAILRMACRVLGFRRRVGGPGVGNAIAGLFTAGLLIAGFATAATAGDPIKLGDAKTQGTGIDSITIGNGAITPSMNSIAIGTNARASWCCDEWTDKPEDDRASIAIGADARSYDDDSVALGRSALTGDGMLRATAIGARAQATAMDALALGAGAKAQFLGGVALGNNSVSDTHGVDTKEVTIDIFTDVGAALGGLNSNITNVNDLVTNLNTRFAASQLDALRWDEARRALPQYMAPVVLEQAARPRLQLSKRLRAGPTKSPIFRQEL